MRTCAVMPWAWMYCLRVVRRAAWSRRLGDADLLGSGSTSSVTGPGRGGAGSPCQKPSLCTTRSGAGSSYPSWAGPGSRPVQSIARSGPLTRGPGKEQLVRRGGDIRAAALGLRRIELQSVNAAVEDRRGHETGTVPASPGKITTYRLCVSSQLSLEGEELSSNPLQWFFNELKSHIVR